MLDFLIKRRALPAALALAGALILLALTRPANAAPCAGAPLAAPPHTQAISETAQPAASLFVCRVDGAGAPSVGLAAGTRSLTAAGLALLVAARWLHFVGYALGFGTIAFGLWAAAALAGLPDAARRERRLVNLGIGLLLCAEPLVLLAQTIGVRGALLDPAVAGDVLASGFGLVWAQRVGAALLLWVVAGAVADGAARARWVALALGLALALVDAVAGARSGALSVGAAALHEAAMGAWMGGLALLLACWGGLDRERRGTALVRFSRLSATAIGALLATGIALAGAALARPAELFSTLYGAALIAKLAVALIAIGLAAFGRRTHGDLWRWRAALAALVAVLGAAGLLVSLPPP